MTIIIDVQREVARSGPRLLSAKQLAEMALQVIGAFSVNDSAADPVHLSRALTWMDLCVQEFVGTTKCFWLIERAIPIALTANKATYDLQDAMGDNLPPGNVLFPLSATIKDTAGNEDLVALIDWEEYEAFHVKSTSGTPGAIFIDRSTPRMEMNVYPVPAVGTFTLNLTVQQYAPDMTHNDGDTPSGLRAEFQLWAIMETAKRIGKGPVKRLALAVANDIAQEAGALRATLKAYSNREQPMRAQPDRVEAWGV